MYLYLKEYNIVLLILIIHVCITTLLHSLCSVFFSPQL